MQISMKIKVPATIGKKGKYYISCCPILVVCSQGETEKKALNNLVEAINLFLISCLERGTLDEVLKACGFVPAKKVVKEKPFPARFKSLDITIPYWIRQAKGLSVCHV